MQNKNIENIVLIICAIFVISVLVFLIIQGPKVEYSGTIHQSITDEGRSYFIKTNYEDSIRTSGRQEEGNILYFYNSDSYLIIKASEEGTWDIITATGRVEFMRPYPNSDGIIISGKPGSRIVMQYMVKRWGIYIPTGKYIHLLIQ